MENMEILGDERISRTTGRASRVQMRKNENTDKETIITSTSGCKTVHNSFHFSRSSTEGPI